jgi:drug/metabolite transporter (DMT)-like permease
MLAIFGGLGAAAMWATATVCSSRSSRMIGAASTVAWVMLVGLAITLPAVVITGVPADLDGPTVGWLVAAGGGNVLGLLLEYRGLRIGKVGVVTSIASTEGAVAALIAVAAGERISPGAGATLAVIAAGVGMAAFAGDDDGMTGKPRESVAAAYAVAAALAFGVSIYATGKVSQELPIPWAVLPARAVGVAAVTIPLALTSRLHIARLAVPLVVVAGVCEVLGFASFALGARYGIAVTAVLGAQFAALSAIAARVLFRERLSRLQLAGMAMIVAGVAILAALIA